MTILNASIVDVGGGVALRIETREGICFVQEPKTPVLAIAAPLNGPDVMEGRIETITITLPPEPLKGISETEVTHCTQDPVILELARLYATRAFDGLGPVDVPTFEQADAAIWRMEGDRLRKISG